MVVSNGSSGPNERTALLNGSAPNSLDPSLGTAIKPTVNGNADGDGSKRGNDESDEADEEAGDVVEENPLFEGNAEMRKKLYLLCPAVGIGVRLLDSFIIYLQTQGVNLDQVFLIAADQTIIVSSYARIGTDLDALNNTSWIATAFVFFFSGPSGVLLTTVGTFLL